MATETASVSVAPSSFHQVSTDEGNAALVKEIHSAFEMVRKKGRDLASDLLWMHQQCSQGGLYPLYAEDRSKLTMLDKQTYRRWKSVMEMERVKHPFRQRRRVVLIQPITHRHGNLTSGEVGYRHTHISETVLGFLQEFCAAFFSEMEVKLAPSLDLSEIPRLTSRIHKATSRRQFLVDDIIHFLSTNKLRNAYCILGVTIVDLYPGPEWNFILGQACMAKGSGVFSFGRYFNSAVSSDGDGCGEKKPGGSGQEDDWEKEQIGNLWVLMRVMSHELCHLFGLNHCHYFQCAMNESGSIREAATQPLFLCPVCLRKLNNVRQLDMEQRFSTLLEVVKHLRTVVAQVTAEEASGLVNLSSDSKDLELELDHERSEEHKPHRASVSPAPENNESHEDACGEQGPEGRMEEGGIKKQESSRSEEGNGEIKEHRREGGIEAQSPGEDGIEERESSREEGEIKVHFPGLGKIQELSNTREGRIEDGVTGKSPGRDARDHGKDGAKKGSPETNMEDSQGPHPQAEHVLSGYGFDISCDMNVGRCGSANGLHVHTNEQLSKMDGAILWLEEAVRSIREFKRHVSSEN